jgi:hypothetical protein
MAINYMCSISHRELERFMDLYYGNMKRLEVGEEVDLARGHDFAAEMQSAFSKTKEFIESHQQIVNAIMNGLRFNNQEPDK